MPSTYRRNCSRHLFASRSAFTLVELSIVLVILGLLVGGVLTGQSLIRAAELRAVTSEYQRYQTAANAFRDKYFAIPGDMTNAASFWTTLTSANNGNGDGYVNAAAAQNVTGEMFQLWNELSLAGLIEGTYSGLASSGGFGYTATPGANVPKSKLSGGAWTLYYNSGTGGDSWSYAADYSNMLAYGSQVANTITQGNILKPEEAWNIDTKIDDGKPGTGKFIARENATWAGAAASKCTTSSSQTDYTGTYNLSATGINCAFQIPKSF